MRRLLVMILALSLALTAGQMLSTAASNDMVHVIIGFKGAPDTAVITALGGTIDRTFTIIPAISATIPGQAVQALERNPMIAYVEPNGMAYTMDNHDNPLSQSVPWGISHIDAPTVHAGGNRGYNVRVAIIDTGIQTNHLDLNTYGGYNFVSNNTNYNDDHGHGTHVAGTVAALDNDIGVLGVAPEARLYGVKVLDSGGGGTFAQIIAGIEWSMNNNMHIANMSLGASSGSTALKDACDTAYNAGVLLVAAAGNSGNSWGWFNTVNYPAKYASVMAVAAVDSNNKRPSWSSHGAEVEIAAPGVNVYSTYIGGSYATMSGTSMASPHVAGVAALVKYKYSSWSNVSIRNRLNSSALYIGNSRYYGNGLVQAIGATQ